MTALKAAITSLALAFRRPAVSIRAPYQDKPPKVLIAVAEPSGGDGPPGFEESASRCCISIPSLHVTKQ
jgi:hypothetical protein